MKKVGAFTVLLFFAHQATANQLWQELDGWRVLVNAEDASRCFAARGLEDGSQVQIGAVPTLNGGFFAIYNAGWTHIVDGQKGEVEFDFGRSRFGGEAVGKIEDGVPGGYVFFDNPAFVFVDQASDLWETVDGSEGKSCSSCHEDVADFAGLRLAGRRAGRCCHRCNGRLRAGGGGGCRDLPATQPFIEVHVALQALFLQRGDFV